MRQDLNFLSRVCASVIERSQSSCMRKVFHWLKLQNITICNTFGVKSFQTSGRLVNNREMSKIGLVCDFRNPKDQLRNHVFRIAPRLTMFW